MMTNGVPPDGIYQRWSQIPCLVCLCVIDLKGTIIQDGHQRVPHDTAHLRSVAHNGNDDSGNLTPLCPSCNHNVGSQHVYEYIVENQSLGLHQLEAWFPNEYIRYQELVASTKYAKKILQRRPLPKDTYDRLIKALEVPIDERLILIKAIFEWN